MGHLEIEPLFRDHKYKAVNFSNYIDYSVPPHFDSNAYFIIDIGNTVAYYSNSNGLIELYRYFPLKEIIKTLLSKSINMSMSLNSHDFIMFRTEELLGDVIESINFDCLELFYEGLQESLDEEISNAIPGYRDSGDYVFDRWIDPVSVCMKLDLCHRYNNGKY